jgi:two-component system sensor histidine kinase TtrS
VEALLSEVQQHPQQRRLWLEMKKLAYPAPVNHGRHQYALLLTLNYIWVMLLGARQAANATPSGCASRSWRCKRQDR